VANYDFIPGLSFAYNLCHINKASFLQKKGLQTPLEIAGTKAIAPTKLVDIRLLVEVVAVLADVVQLGVDGSVVFTTALVGHAAVSFAIMHGEGRVCRILSQQGQPRVKWWT